MTATTISLLNMKGGVGKTTLAVNLAWHLCRRGNRKALLIDLDPQFNASQYLMDYTEWEKHTRTKGTVADLLLEPKKTRLSLARRRRKKTAKKSPKATGLKAMLHRVEKTKDGGILDLLPSDLALGQAVKNPQALEFKLATALDQVREGYDFIFIDCAPTDSVLTAVALMASDYVLTPVKPDRFSILGYQLILETVDTFRNNYPDPRGVMDLGVVFTQVRGGEEIEDRCISDVSKTAEHVFDTHIKQATSYLRSVHEQTPVFDTRYARALTRARITSLVSELEKRIEALDAEREAASAT